MSFLHGHSEHSAELYPLPKCCNNTIEERYSWSTSACLTRDIWRVRIAISLHIFNNRYLFVLGNKMNTKIYALLSCVCVVSSLIFVLFVLSTSCFPALFLLLDQITTHQNSWALLSPLISSYFIICQSGPYGEDEDFSVHSLLVLGSTNPWK